MIVLTNYTFDPATRRITISGLAGSLELERVREIWNLTRKTAYYAPVPAAAGDNALTQPITIVSTNIIELPANTPLEGHNASDALRILYDTDATGGGGGGGGAVTIADGADVAQGARADAAASSDTGTFSIIAFIKRGLQNWTTLLGRIPASPADTARQDTANTQLTNVNTALGAQADAAASSDTGTFSLLAFIKRGLQNWTTLLSRIPSLIGGAFPVTEPPLVLTGAGAQTATVNNILENPSGTAGTNVEGYRSASVQVVSTGTGGTFIFEQSNDNVNWRPIVVKNAELTTGAVINAAITASASQIVYRFPIGARFIRLRIATTITGGSIQAFTRLSTEPFTDIVQNVGQPTAASLNVTASGTVTANIGTGSLAAGTNAIGDVGAQVRANATGAASPFNLNSPATPAGQSIKGSPGRVLTLYARNNNAASRWLKLFNATSVTMGVTAAIADIEIPPTSTGITIPLPDAGLGFGAGIQAAVTGGRGLTDNTAITLNDVSGFGTFA